MQRSGRRDARWATVALVPLLFLLLCQLGEADYDAKDAMSVAKLSESPGEARRQSTATARDAAAVIAKAKALAKRAKGMESGLFQATSQVKVMKKMNQRVNRALRKCELSLQRGGSGRKNKRLKLRIVHLERALGKAKTKCGRKTAAKKSPSQGSHPSDKNLSTESKKNKSKKNKSKKKGYVGITFPIKADPSDPNKFDKYRAAARVPVFIAEYGRGGSGTAPKGGEVKNGCGRSNGYGLKEYTYPPAKPHCECIKPPRGWIKDRKTSVKVSKCGKWDVGSGRWVGANSQGWCFTSRKCMDKNKGAWGSIKGLAARRGAAVVSCETVDAAAQRRSCGTYAGGTSKEVLCPVVGHGVTCPAAFPFPGAYNKDRDQKHEGCNMKDTVTCYKTPMKASVKWYPWFPKKEADWKNYHPNGASYFATKRLQNSLNAYWKVECVTLSHARCKVLDKATRKQACAIFKKTLLRKIAHCPTGASASCRVWPSMRDRAAGTKWKGHGGCVRPPLGSCAKLPQHMSDFHAKGGDVCAAAATAG